MSSSLGPLGEGGKVVIIGGGPGGAGCAIALRHLAQARGINMEVILYEGKIFAHETHFNQCAGVLSPPIVSLFETQLGIEFPVHLVQRKIRGYVLHSDRQQIDLDGEEEISYAVRRVTFDQYLLEQAIRTGVEVIQSRVTDIEFDTDHVMVYSESKATRADVVVGAFGLDDGTARLLERRTSYRQPDFLHAVIVKIHPGEQAMAAFGDRIHAFLPSVEEIEFGAIIPKWNHLTIDVAGAAVTAESMDRFLDLPSVRSILPSPIDAHQTRLEYFKGKFPISPARGLFGDRYVVVGDAAGLVRPFKGKGVNAGIITGNRAAETMISTGVSRSAFERYYRSCREVTEDLPYGRMLRRLAILSSNYGMLDRVLRLAEQDDILRKALFYCVSAHKTYRTIFRETRSWGLAMRLIRTALQSREA